MSDRPERPLTAMEAHERLAPAHQVRIEFAGALRQIAQVLQYDVVAGLSAFNMIEAELERRVTALVAIAERRAYDDGFRRGRQEAEQRFYGDGE